MAGRKRKHKRPKVFLLWSRNMWIRREEVGNISRLEDKYLKNLNLVKLEKSELVVDELLTLLLTKQQLAPGEIKISVTFISLSSSTVVIKAIIASALKIV